MSILSGIKEVLSGGAFVTKVLDTIKEYLPPDMAPSEKAKLQLELNAQAAAQQQAADKALAEAERLINERVAMFEGTATDLRSIPIFGPIVLFLRGLQRLVWGYGVLYFDFCWFSGKLAQLTQQQESALWLINLLVLGFLFGEKAVQNLAPLVADVLQKQRK